MLLLFWVPNAPCSNVQVLGMAALSGVGWLVVVVKPPPTHENAGL